MRHSAVAASLLVLLLAACASFEPFEPPVAGELNPEPGLFTGPSGVFVLSPAFGAEVEAEGGSAGRRLTDPPPP